MDSPEPATPAAWAILFWVVSLALTGLTAGIFQVIRHHKKWDGRHHVRAAKIEAVCGSYALLSLIVFLLVSFRLSFKSVWFLIFCFNHLPTYLGRLRSAWGRVNLSATLERPETGFDFIKLYFKRFVNRSKIKDFNFEMSKETTAGQVVESIIAGEDNAPDSASPIDLQITKLVFISHSSKDKTFADAVLHGLEEAGIRCWIAPRDLDRVAGPWAGSITRAIREAAAFVLIFSEYSNSSGDVMNEVNLAVRQTPKIPVIPFRLHNCEPNDDLAYYASRLHWLDAVHPPLQARIKLLATTLRGLLLLNEQPSPPISHATAPKHRGSKSALECERWLEKLISTDWGCVLRPRRKAALIILVILCVFWIGYALVSRFFHTELPSKPFSLPTELENPQNLASQGLTFTVNGPNGDVKFTIRSVPAGRFYMGSLDTEAFRHTNENGPDGRPIQTVFKVPFWLMETEVTQGLFAAITGETVSNNDWRTYLEKRTRFDTIGLSSFDSVGEAGSNQPMNFVNAKDADNWVTVLNLKVPLGSKWKWALPTEAQWEYACRSGTTGKFSGNLNALGWYRNNSQGHTHEVREKFPNEWGLYDMHGNVSELCLDTCQGAISLLPGGIDPLGTAGSERVSRGGSWRNDGDECRSAYRGGGDAIFRHSALGFRCAVVPTQ